MSPVLERAARALCEDMGEVWDNESSAWKSIHRSRVRAVLMAVRDGMLDEGGGKIFNRSSAATIDAILNEASK